MSQSSSARTKDVGRKPYNSLNVNYAFKSSKGETKSTTGQNVRPGLQSLGKVANTRRTPAPANLPSLKSENSGNDPSINLVPAGQGWGKKGSAPSGAKKTEKPTVTAAPIPVKAVPPKNLEAHKISLRPNAGVVPNIKPPTLPTAAAPTASGDNQDTGKVTWGSKVQQKQPAAGTTYFHREFPKLGGMDGKREVAKENDHHGESAPDASHPAMAHPDFAAGGQKWMDSSGSRMQVPMNMPPFSGERPMFNGSPMQCSYIYPMYPPHGGRMMAPFPYPYNYPGSGGKMPGMDPRFMLRMKGQVMGLPVSQTDRPSVVKDCDLRSLDDQKDDTDNGWAGSNEEVDYTAKLRFDESDESDDDTPADTSKKSDQPKSQSDSVKEEKNSQDNWNEYTHGYSQQMMMAFTNQHWQRPPFPGYDPQQGPPPHGFPFPSMYHPMFFQQNMTPPSNENVDEQQSGEKAEVKESSSRGDEKREEKKELDLKARLKMIEKVGEDIKKRESTETIKKQFSEDDNKEMHRINRSRNNSEASDSSRRSSSTNEIPPRFRHIHDQLPAADNETVDSPRAGSESPHLTIMKRKDSIKSEDGFPKEDYVKRFDNAEKIPVESIDERFEDLGDQKASQHSSSSSLHKEKIKSERQKRYSSSADAHDKDRSALHGSASSIHKDHEKKEERVLSRRELKDLSESRSKEMNKNAKVKNDGYRRTSRDDTDGRAKPSELQKIDSGRFADLKLTKGQTKTTPAQKEDIDLGSVKKGEPAKSSPWSNVVSGRPVADKFVGNGKSLRDIQMEEEEEQNNRKQKKVNTEKTFTDRTNGSHGDHNNVRSGDSRIADANRFRSDGYGSRNVHDSSNIDENKFEDRGYERRGRFDKRPRSAHSRYKDQSGSRSKDDNWVERREYNHRREENRMERKDIRTDRRDDYRNERDESNNERKEDQRGSRREDGRDSEKNERRDDHKSDWRDDIKNERKGDHRIERKDHQRNDKRDERRNDRRDDYKSHGYERREGSKSERRDERSGNKSREFNKDESKEDKRYERRDVRNMEAKKDDSEDKGRRDDYRRYDKYDNSRKDSRRETYKKNEQRDDKKGHFREDRRREDQRYGRKDYGRGDSGRNYQNQSEFTKEDKIYESRQKKDEWSKRDFRQSAEYQKSLQERGGKRDGKKNADLLKDGTSLNADKVNDLGKEIEKAVKVDDSDSELIAKACKKDLYNDDLEESKQIVESGPMVSLEKVELQEDNFKAEKPKESEAAEETLNLDIEQQTEVNPSKILTIDLTTEGNDDHSSKVTERKEVSSKGISDLLSSKTVVDVPDDSSSNEVGSSVVARQTENSKVKSGGFGVPDKSNRKTRRPEPWKDSEDLGHGSESNYHGEFNFRGESNYRGESTNRGRERGRGRGRGYSRGPTNSSRSRRPSNSRYRSTASREETRRRKDHDYYENISSGDFTEESDNEKEKTKSSYNEMKDSRKHEPPPRFQNRFDSRESRGGRGRGRGFRSGERGRIYPRERGRGRGRGRSGTPSTAPNHSTSVPFTENKSLDEEKNDGYSDAYYSAAEETSQPEEKDDHCSEKGASLPIHVDRDGKPRSQNSQRSSRGGKGRNPRGNKGSFLANRQQVGAKRSKSEKTLPAADKSASAEVYVNGKAENHVKNQLNLEDISPHSPPKKSKNQIEKREDRRREMYKEFDVNNIASVVCIDDIKIGVQQATNSSLEEDGFVTVTSKKQQKEKRDREREEMKKKMLMEQKKESAAANKSKTTRNAPKGNSSINSKTKSASNADTQISSPTTEQVPSSTATISSPVSQHPSSNVAMAAFGVWEPAESLMRTSQQNIPPSSDMAKTSLASTISTSINAWQRPLSLAATSDISVPDPRAVGTGKPSSSHSTLMNKSSLVPTQPTPESASPLVTPPALAPIGSTTLSNASNAINTELATTVIAADERLADSLGENTAKKEKSETVLNDFDVDSQPADGKQNEKREMKPKRNITKMETPPRFLTLKENDDRGKNEDAKKLKPVRQMSDDKRNTKRSVDRSRKGDMKSNQDKKQVRKKDDEKKVVDDNGPIVFINEIPSPVDNSVEKVTPKSTLSDADKVVGSNKPSLKSQSSLGSFSAESNIEEAIVDVNITESYQAQPVENEVSVEKDEQKLDGNVRSGINSINEEEERSLETRSLPGTPPLAVKIPEPLPPGPSSDPGRGPSPPSLDKSIAPSIAHEMNEMNRLLLNARKVWEDTPTTWSDTQVVSSTTSTDVTAVTVDSVPPQKIIEETNIPGSPTKSESSAAPSIEVRQKSSEEKPTVPVGVFSSKRTEQQVCKVKPQQQLPSEDVKSYQNVNRQPNQLNSQRTNSNQTSKYASYCLPVDRNLHQNTNTLYTSDSMYGADQHLSQNNQPLNFPSLAPGRSMSSSVTPHSQQRDMVLSSLQVDNMYSNTLQASQSQFLAWQVTPTVHPTKTVPYLTYSQGSSFTSPVSIAANSPVIMQYGTTSFASQRSTSNIQRQQHLSLMQLQQHQPPQAGRLVNMMHSRGGSHVRRNQQYQTMQSTSDGRIFNPNQIPLMLDPGNNGSVNQPQQLSGQQRSDLMKHVHAKPFEPTSQTPPLMQSPPVVPHQTLPPQQTHQQQQMVPSVFSQPATVAHQHVQNIQHYSQPMMQQRQHGVGVHHMQHQGPLVASVRPTSIQEQNLSNVSSSVPMANQDRINNISPFNPFVANTVSYKGRSGTHRGNVQHATVPQQPINNHFPQHALQAQRHVPSRPTNVALGMISGPGPIQRPQVHQQPAIVHEKAYLIDASVSNDGGFKQDQRQRMLEATKKYFEQDAILNKADPEEKQVSSVLPKVVSPSHKENQKKIEFKKNARNNGDFKSRPKRVPPKVSKKLADATSQPPNQRSASKV